MLILKMKGKNEIKNESIVCYVYVCVMVGLKYYVGINVRYYFENTVQNVHF